MPVSSASQIAAFVALGGAFATLGLMILQARQRIAALEDWAWGPDRDETDAGVAGSHESLAEKIDRIEQKLDDERAERRQDHAEVESAVYTNREYTQTAIGNLIGALDEDRDDVEPDWATDWRAERGQGFDGNVDD